jgi:Cu(I)/Ag(I) efflux system membrane protein CusA/SilA
MDDILAATCSFPHSLPIVAGGGARLVRRAAEPEDLDDALIEGGVLRVRPKAMTVAVILAGLFPLLIGHGTGSELMQRRAAPMIGGMITAPLLSLLEEP